MNDFTELAEQAEITKFEHFGLMAKVEELEEQLAKKSIIEYKESEEIKLESPLEQLRYFCSIAFSKDDWINSENFFIALEKQLAESIPKSEIKKVEQGESIYYKKQYYVKCKFLRELLK